MSNTSTFRFLIGLAVVALSASACGGEPQQGIPAQSPAAEPSAAESAEPSAEPASGAGGAGGEHLMPNGEMMPNHQM